MVTSTLSSPAGLVEPPAPSVVPLTDTEWLCLAALAVVPLTDTA